MNKKILIISVLSVMMLVLVPNFPCIELQLEKNNNLDNLNDDLPKFSRRKGRIYIEHCNITDIKVDGEPASEWDLHIYDHDEPLSNVEISGYILEDGAGYIIGQKLYAYFPGFLLMAMLSIVLEDILKYDRERVRNFLWSYQLTICDIFGHRFFPGESFTITISKLTRGDTWGGDTYDENFYISGDWVKLY
jgi:hypothetical protein